MVELDPISLVSENKKENESLLDYAVRLSALYASSKNLDERKAKSQFFTPKEISSFMANMINIKKNNFRLLDPGAGVGNLTAAFCNRLTKHPTSCSISVDAYENDPVLIPGLKTVFEVCKNELKKYGHEMNYHIYEKDFVLHNQKILDKESLISFEIETFYDYILSNPPYYKLERSSNQAILMRKFISAHPNIYALFMILSAKMLNKEGELVFITPRSFCSGMYYKKFRNWFLRTVRLKQIHIFESRKDIFGIDEVLQENIIINAICSQGCKDSVKVSSSRSKLFEFYNEIAADRSDVLFHKNGDVFIRIPTSRRDIAILRLVDEWPETLNGLGLEVSTGPVVVFRTRKNVLDNIETPAKYVPLLWMHNFRNMNINWPIKKKNKPSYIYSNVDTEHLLCPLTNYVLIGRFSFKEQKKRLNVAVLSKNSLPFDTIGIENHINFIHRIDGELTKDETFGIAVLFNTNLVDNYFRSLNGSTQVNAVDLRSLPLPSMSEIREIGKRFLERKANDVNYDKIVYEVLQINNNKFVNHGW